MEQREEETSLTVINIIFFKKTQWTVKLEPWKLGNLRCLWIFDYFHIIVHVKFHFNFSSPIFNLTITYNRIFFSIYFNNLFIRPFSVHKMGVKGEFSLVLEIFDSSNVSQLGRVDPALGPLLLTPSPRPICVGPSLVPDHYN